MSGLPSTILDRALGEIRIRVPQDNTIMLHA